MEARVTLPFHQLAKIFPPMRSEEFAELLHDVRQHGVREKITILDGKILDGRNRYTAALKAGILKDDDRPADCAGIFYKFVREVDGDPLAFVISRNLKRRHLNDDQRRMVAARLVNMGPGRPSETPAECGIKVAEAAKMVNTDEAGNERARTVLANAALEIQTAIEHGKMTVAAGVQAAKLDPNKQRKIAEEAQAGRANVVRTVLKQEMRAERERDLGQKQLAAPNVLAGVIVEDFEWDHVTWSDKGRDRAAENHYIVARDAHTAQEIVERTRERFKCAAPDCVLWMWSTVQHLAIAIDVMRLRGFDYKSHYIWGKDSISLGYWGRNKHEILLIGVRGDIPCPAPGTQWESLVMAPKGAHSAKPEAFLEMIEGYFPTLPKVELNCRGEARPGWIPWGNEAELPPQNGESSSGV
jgi:N6-adenosine-specific RNA methylase IME4